MQGADDNPRAGFRGAGVPAVARPPCIQRMLCASEGMRQSPRGERLTEPTFGPSGMHERLNCCWKKRRQKDLEPVADGLVVVILSVKRGIFGPEELGGDAPPSIWYRKKSCSVGPPTRSSVFCAIWPFLVRGRSSGETGVSRMSSRTPSAGRAPRCLVYCTM